MNGNEAYNEVARIRAGMIINEIHAKNRAQKIKKIFVAIGLGVAVGVAGYAVLNGSPEFAGLLGNFAIAGGLGSRLSSGGIATSTDTVEEDTDFGLLREAALNGDEYNNKDVELDNTSAAQAALNATLE